MLSDKMTKVLGFAAFSGTGKTSLLTRLIPILKSYHLKIGLIKHSHHDFEIDYAGKDSYALRKAGASPVMIISPYRRAVIYDFKPEKQLNFQEELAEFLNIGLDLILVEGFKEEAIPKIEIHRPVLGKPLLYLTDPNIIAIASDEVLQTPAEIPCLDLNNLDEICQFILKKFSFFDS